jgi:hypothetical protein
MCLPIPAVKQGEELKEQCSLGRVENFERGFVWFRKLSERVQRFAPGRYGRALPRTPANFRLSQSRFAGLCTALTG